MSDEPIQPAGEERIQYRSFTSREDIDRALKQIEEYSESLRLMGARILVFAFASLATLTFSSLARFFFTPQFSGPQDGGTSVFPMVFAMVLSLPFLGLVILFCWEKRVALGTILYEEVSDEIEWRHRTFRKPDPQENGVEPQDPERGVKRRPRPNLEARLVLRRFLKESTLPFARGPNGTSIYAIFFVACILLTILIVVFQFRF